MHVGITRVEILETIREDAVAALTQAGFVLVPIQGGGRFELKRIPALIRATTNQETQDS